MSADLLTAARAEALFTSHLSQCSVPDAKQVAAAITAAVRAHGGTRGCAAEVAAEYGEHPETAPGRMRWARRVVESVYPGGRHAGRHLHGMKNGCARSIGSGWGSTGRPST
jgi:hypothetical protein